MRESETTKGERCGLVVVAFRSFIVLLYFGFCCFFCLFKFSLKNALYSMSDSNCRIISVL